jgi:hypothetical protein
MVDYCDGIFFVEEGTYHINGDKSNTIDVIDVECDATEKLMFLVSMTR